MPRPRKKGLDYFPLDTDFFSDQKVKILKARYGTDGIACFLYLLCEIYKNGYYVNADEDFFYVMAEDLKMSVDKVKQVLAFLLERSMFDEQLFQSDAALTSTGIQKRFQLAVKERAKKTPIEVSGLWLLDAEETEPFIKCVHHDGFSRKNDSNSRKNDSNSRDLSLKESKVKKSKVNIGTNVPQETKKKSSGKGKVQEHYPLDDELRSAFMDFVDMRKKIKKPMTDRAMSMLKGRLNKLATVNGQFDRNMAIAILNQSVMNCWQNVYPLKDADWNRSGTCNTVQVTKKNGFHNFDQRPYDYDALEKMLSGKGG